MSKQTVGVTIGRSAKANDEMKDKVLSGELPKVGIPPADAAPAAPYTAPKGADLVDRRVPIDYFRILDDVIANIYERNAGAYAVTKAVTQMFESRGQPTPFSEGEFLNVCMNLSKVQAAKEIALGFGLGLEHADKVADLMIDRLFGRPK